VYCDDRRTKRSERKIGDEREHVKDCCVYCDDRRTKRSESERKNGAARRSASV